MEGSPPSPIGRRAFTALAILLPLAILLLGAGEALGIECRTKAGKEKGWSWREIAGKRCWYLGPRGIDKRRLTWAQAKPPTKPQVKPKRIEPLKYDPKSGYSEEEWMLIYCCWPPLNRKD